MSTAVFPGSFDPVTTGHVDLIRRASRMFDRLVVGVLVNSAKQPLFSKEERVAMLREITADQVVKEQHADAIVRGLRTPGDFEYELPLAQANHKLSVQADTIFLASAPEYSYISSSAVRELLRYQADISGYVPETVLRYMREHGVVSN